MKKRPGCEKGVRAWGDPKSELRRSANPGSDRHCLASVSGAFGQPIAWIRGRMVLFLQAQVAQEFFFGFHGAYQSQVDAIRPQELARDAADLGGSDLEQASFGFGGGKILPYPNICSPIQFI